MDRKRLNIEFKALKCLCFVLLFFLKGVKYTQNETQRAKEGGKEERSLLAEGHLSGSLTNKQKLMISCRGQGQKVLLHTIFTLMTYSCFMSNGSANRQRHFVM